MQIYVYSKILVFFNQVLKPIRDFQRPNDSIPNSFWRNLPLEKNHAEFLRDCETYCFKAAKTLAKFPRRNLEILFTCLLRV